MIFLYILGALLVLFLLYVLFLFICSLPVSTKKEYEKHSKFYRMLLNGATALAMKIMRIRIHTTGVEKVPQDTKNLLFVGNHRSNYDPIIQWHIFKKWQPAFISKASNFKIPIFGRFIRKCCFMAIDRENPRNALKTIIKASNLLQKGEVSIGVYPEGTRSKSGVLLPFHNGVFKIAQKAEADIVVLAVQGTEKIFKNYPFHHTDVYLDVIEVLPAEEVKHTKTDVLGERIRNLLESRLNKTNGVPYENKSTDGRLPETTIQ